MLKVMAELATVASTEQTMTHFLRTIFHAVGT
jgi:hypothetical protein